MAVVAGAGAVGNVVVLAVVVAQSGGWVRVRVHFRAHVRCRAHHHRHDHSHQVQAEAEGRSPGRVSWGWIWPSQCRDLTTGEVYCRRHSARPLCGATRKGETHAVEGSSISALAPPFPFAFAFPLPSSFPTHIHISITVPITRDCGSIKAITERLGTITGTSHIPSTFLVPVSVFPCFPCLYNVLGSGPDSEHVLTFFNAEMPLPLPTEIVVCILESFVAFPDVMDTSRPHYALYPNGFLPVNDIKRSIQSLSLLALVCQQWNIICTPILYQCLVVDDSTVTNALLNTLQGSRTTADTLGRLQPLSFLTRHLIIALSDRPAHSREAEPLEIRILRRFGDLGKLASCLPYLQILSISISIPAVLGLPMPHYGRNFAASVARTSARSLRKLFLYQNPVVLFSPGELRTLLESTPNLVALIGADYIGCPVALPYLPKLKYLAVSSEGVHCDGTKHFNDQTPSLDHVHFGPNHSSTSLMHFLSAWGPKLTSVSFDLRTPVEPTPLPRNQFNCPQMLGSLCPNISHLEIFITNWHFFSQSDWPLSIEYLSIHLVFSGVTVSDICKTLAGIHLPSLKVVRFLDPEMDEWLGSPQSGNVDGAWSRLRTFAFRVVNHDGHQLGPSGRYLEYAGTLPSALYPQLIAFLELEAMYP